MPRSPPPGPSGGSFLALAVRPARIFQTAHRASATTAGSGEARTRSSSRPPHGTGMGQDVGVLEHQLGRRPPGAGHPPHAALDHGTGLRPRPDLSRAVRVRKRDREIQGVDLGGSRPQSDAPPPSAGARRARRSSRPRRAPDAGRRNRRGPSPTAPPVLRSGVIRASALSRKARGMDSAHHSVSKGPSEAIARRARSPSRVDDDVGPDGRAAWMEPGRHVRARIEQRVEAVFQRVTSGQGEKVQCPVSSTIFRDTTWPFAPA